MKTTLHGGERGLECHDLNVTHYGLLDSECLNSFCNLLVANAKVFTKLDCKNGYWQVKLDQDLCSLTTFNTPFGSYKVDQDACRDFSYRGNFPAPTRPSH